METENVRKQLKINQNIWKMLWCIENANKNIQSKLHVPTVICLIVAPKTKIDFFKNRFCVKIPFFRKNFTFYPPPTNKKYQLDSLSYQKSYC